MNDNKLYITISDNRGKGGIGGIGGEKPTPTIEELEKREDKALFRYAEHEMFHIVKNATVQSVNFAISNIGNLTGDYITQKNVNYAKGVLSNMMAVGMTTLAGAKYGPVGAVVGFVAGVASIATSAVFGDITKTMENAKMNYEIGQLKERAGLNTFYDGSRGTEN